MTEENKKLWQSVLSEIELSISKANFNMWFKDTFINKQEEGTIFVGVPNVFVKDWLINKYHKNILKSLRSFGEHIHAVEYLVIKPEGKRELPKENRYPVLVPPLVGVAVNRTLVPGHTGNEGEADITTEGVTLAMTIMVVVLDVAVVGLAHDRADVITHETVLLLAKVALE